MGKPRDWDKLPPEEKQRIGLSLLRSIRGQYIVSQALSKAIEVMKKVKPPRKEVSNIEDMEILHETLFPLYQPELMKIGEELKKKKLKEALE